MSESSGEWRSQCDLLRRLLFEPGRRAELQVGAGLLRWTDARQLDSTVRRLIARVGSSHRRGALPVKEMFGRTLEGMNDSDFAALLAKFCASTWFARHGEVVDQCDQLCIEEAMYRFLCAQNIGPADLRRLEFVDAMIRALTVQKRPAFQIPAEIESAPFGYVALATLAGEDHLFAVVGGRMLRGPIGALTAEVIRRRAIRPADAAIATTAWDAAVTQLAALGLVYGGEARTDRSL